MEIIQLQITFDQREEALALAKLLLDTKLVADGQVSEITSLFNFEDKFHDRKEWLLTAKTKKSLYTECEKFIKQAHSFKCPQIVATELTHASKDYADWVKENTK